MTLRVCAEPGCPLLTPNTRCLEHAKAKRRESAARRPATPEQQMYKGIGTRGRAWRQVRQHYLEQHPICQWHEGCLAPAVHVHHIDGDPLGPNGLDPLNLEGLCQPHHSRKTAKQQPGGWHASSVKPPS